SVSRVEIFDPKTNRWATPVTTGSFSSRAFLTSSVVEDKIYVIGGSSSGSVYPDTMLEVFDPKTNAWSTPTTTGVFSPRAAHTASVVDRRIYVLCGEQLGNSLRDPVVFDPTTNTWSALDR